MGRCQAFRTVGSLEEIGRIVAGIVAEEIRRKPELVLGLATGSSPVPLYAELAGLYVRGEVDFSRVRTINLDEYIGLPPEHPQSYRYFMEEKLFSRINIAAANTHLPDGMAEDLAAECARYDALIESMGGIDLQLLGVGRNGHIGFNEPAEVFSRGTQVVALTPNTLEANARFFAPGEEMPKTAITMGIRNIMLARRIVLVAGAIKRDILERALTGEITPRVPCSVLQLHRDVSVFVVDGAGV